ncbi:PH domain-containing protein [Pseudalkalibacillus sp. SCS-8]|uniref:PH domain-containing protein n=1 Tax=Pseudalkalibacillus nanhaiensis TaxID=3115291 RepID=UPI0032DA6A13
MYFPSRKDWWVTVLIWGLVGISLLDISLGLGWGVMMVPFLGDFYFFRLVVLALFSSLLLWIWFRTGYRIEKTTLTIFYGPFRKSLELEDLNSVKEVKDPFVAPALSIHRLELNYGTHHTVRISPVDQDEFITYLQLNSKINRKSGG